MQAKPAITTKDITGLILAGGQGRRMGGANKGLQHYQDKPLIEHVMERLRPQVDRLIISANADGDVYARYGYPVIADALKGCTHQEPFLGPLAGILSGLFACETPYLLVSPCDTPHFPLDLAQSLCALGAPSFVKSHALFCLLPQSSALYIENCLAKGQRRVQDCWTTLGARALGSGVDCFAFKNINTRSDLVSI